MSIRQGKKLIASSTTNGFNLFDCKWADHILNNISWLRADTFSWQSGDVYAAAYEHLDEDLKNTADYLWIGDTTGINYITKGRPSVGDTVVGGGYTVGEVGSDYIVVYRDGVEYERATFSSTTFTPQNETIGDITISYYLSDDGHKICTPDQESNLVALYNKTGVAWYYILDTTNRQFKLPRTKWGFTGLRDSVGGYVAPGLPNITGQSNVWGSNSESGALKTTITSTAGLGGSVYSIVGNIRLDASKSNAIYGASDTVQPPATQMYLYFYVGNFTQTALENTAGLNAELFNGKADRNLLNTTDNVDIVIESQFPTAGNSYTWYRKYKSGWVEQGGVFDAPNNTAGVEKTITLPLPMTNDKYTITIGVRNTTNDYNVYLFVATKTSTTITFKCNIANAALADQNWQVSGMSAQ